MSFCKVSVSTDKSIQIDSETKIAFDNKISDPFSEFDTITNKFTTVTAGDYLIVCSVNWLVESGKYWSENQYDKVIINLNGNALAFALTWHTTMFSATTTQVVTLVNMSVGDYIEAYVRHDNSFPLYVGTSSYMSIKQL